MTERDEGGPAFPQHDLSGYGIGPTMKGFDPSDPYSGKYEVTGMTLRDWFAGQALTAAAMQAFDDDTTVEGNARVAAVWAYAVADAMLEARK